MKNEREGEEEKEEERRKGIRFVALHIEQVVLSFPFSNVHISQLEQKGRRAVRRT
jgi:hypothetical protein